MSDQGGRNVVVLVNETGEVVGQSPKLAAHEAPGHLHLAFSVFLFDPEGRTVLQQRAATKYHFPLYWANACCSHPAPGESILESAVARVREELGLEVLLEPAGQFLYQAADPGGSMVEHELDHVFVGELPPDTAFDPDPDEIAALAFTTPEELRSGSVAGPLAPWVLDAFEIAMRYRGAETVPG